MEQPDDERRRGQRDRLGAAAGTVDGGEAGRDEECDRECPPGQARRRGTRAALPHTRPRVPPRSGAGSAEDPQSRVDARPPVPAGAETASYGRHHSSDKLRLMHHRRDRMARDAADLVSFGDGFVTVCSYGRADCGRDLQLGRSHRLLSSRAGARAPSAGQAHLLRGVFPARRDRHDLLWDSAPSGGRRMGGARLPSTFASTSRRIEASPATSARTGFPASRPLTRSATSWPR